MIKPILVINLAVGNMSTAKARQYINSLQEHLNSIPGLNLDYYIIILPIRDRDSHVEVFGYEIENKTFDELKKYINHKLQNDE